MGWEKSPQVEQSVCGMASGGENWLEGPRFVMASFVLQLLPDEVGQGKKSKGWAGSNRKVADG